MRLRGSERETAYVDTYLCRFNLSRMQLKTFDQTRFQAGETDYG